MLEHLSLIKYWLRQDPWMLMFHPQWHVVVA